MTPEQAEKDFPSLPWEPKSIEAYFFTSCQVYCHFIKDTRENLGMEFDSTAIIWAMESVAKGTYDQYNLAHQTFVDVRRELCRRMLK